MPEVGTPESSGLPVLARGRDAVVYDLGDGKVLRQFPTDRDLSHEVEMMRHVAAHGYPVPEVFDVTARSMVLERVSGPTMLDAMASRPWTFARHARTLASLHDRLHALTAPTGARPAFGDTPGSDGTAVVHGDLHPGNVLISPAGPVVIDWTGAGRGNPSADVADMWLILGAAKPDGGRVLQLLADLLRRRFLNTFLSALSPLASTDGGGASSAREAAAALLPASVARRERDPNMGADELGRMRKIAASATS